MLKKYSDRFEQLEHTIYFMMNLCVNNSHQISVGSRERRKWVCLPQALLVLVGKSTFIGLGRCCICMILLGYSIYC
jgi:hypothetical protein